MTCLPILYSLIFLLVDVDAAGIGEAWQVMPHTKPVHMDHSSRRRLDSSAFEVRTVSGVGRLMPTDETENHSRITTLDDSAWTPDDSVSTSSTGRSQDASYKNKDLDYPRISFDDSYNDDEIKIKDDAPPVHAVRKIFRDTFMTRLLHALKNEDDDRVDYDEEAPNETTTPLQRFRRQAANETSMEKVSTTKSVRDVRLNSPETWSSTSVQPISVEFRQRIPLDQVVQQQQREEEEAAAAAALANSYRRYPQAPRTDFVTGHHHHYRRGYPEYRESRDMSLAGGRGYDNYEALSWYRNAIRDRDYEFSYPFYRRRYNYQYPDRYRTERDYYVRPPSDHYHDYRYDRYRDEELDALYGRQRSTPKPKRVVYYATLPEIVRKPVDLRNYPRGSPYDNGAVRSPTTRDDAYKRIPGNVDPGKYRYRNAYNGYDPYAKRSSYYDRGYGYPDGEMRRVTLSTKDDPKNKDGFGEEQRQVSNLIAIRDHSGKLPWPMQIGTEVSIKDDERITGRKVFGELAGGYERYQSAQLQKAPDATESSELQGDN